MKAIKIGNQFKLYDDSIQTFDRLPAQTYTVCFGQFTGFYLEEHADLDVKEKVYGIHEAKVDKVLNAFSSFERSLGVILSGNKGIGKSLFAKLLCKKANAEGLPVVIVEKFIPGIAEYIETIEQEVVVLFDEFDKTFGGVRVADNETPPQTSLLSLFDGTACGKKLFIVTCNELRNLSDYLINRPGRFHYHFRFEYPSDQEIREYMTDKLEERFYPEIERVVAFSKRVRLNFDCLRAIAFELNSGDSFEAAIGDLNIVNYDAERYSAVLHFEDGTKLTNRAICIDLFSEEDVNIAMYDRTGENLCDVEFNPEDAIYSSEHSTTIVTGDTLRTPYWDDGSAAEALRKKKISYLSLTHMRERKLHYYDV